MSNSAAIVTLVGDPADLEQLRRCAPVEARAVNRGSRRRFERTYFDTPDRRLSGRHLTLSVSKAGPGYRQTLEAGADGVGAPGSWEAVIDGGQPTVRAIPSLEARERIGLILPGDLVPVYACRGTRHRRTLSVPNQPPSVGLIAAFVEGETERDGTLTPLAAVEIEPCAAAPAAAYELALELHRLAPGWRWQPHSEAARVLNALTGGPPPWCKAKQPVMAPELSVSDALAAVVRSCVTHWRLNEAAAVDGQDPEGVHQLRVAVRRLLSAFSVFADIIPEDQRAALRSDTKRLLNALGPARDLDVFLTELLAPILAARPEDEDLGELRRVAERERGRAYETVRTTIADPSYTALLLRTAAWGAGRAWRTDTPQAEPLMRELADPLLAKRARKAKKRGRGFADLPDAERHRVRIALKRVRYAAEFFNALYPPDAVAPFLKALKDLQDSLGHLNDVAVAEQRVAELVACADSPEQERRLRNAAGLVLGWHSHSLAQLEPRLVASWRAFAEQPGFAG